MERAMPRPSNFVLILFPILASLSAAEHPKPYRLPALPDHMPPVIWGSECQVPDGPALSFAGEELKSDDGQHHTQFKTSAASEWISLYENLRTRNPLQPIHDNLWNLRTSTKNTLAKFRFAYLQGRAPDPKWLNDEVLTPLNKIIDGLSQVTEPPGLPRFSENNFKLARVHADAALSSLRTQVAHLNNGLSVENIKALHGAQIELEQAAAFLDAEPGRAPSRQLSSMNGLNFSFCLAAITSITSRTTPGFSIQSKRMATAPSSTTRLGPGRTIKLVAADGKIKLTGGYTYANNTDYMGGQYIDVNDGAWVYDIAANRWTSSSGAKPVAADTRTYREGPFSPDFFLQIAPDAKSFAKTLENLPPNTWVQTKPPFLPQMQRDWGTAVIDPDHDVMLRWSGGHCAHGGSDVVMYHFSTNRWEAPLPRRIAAGPVLHQHVVPSRFQFQWAPMDHRALL